MYFSALKGFKSVVVYFRVCDNKRDRTPAKENIMPFLFTPEVGLPVVVGTYMYHIGKACTENVLGKSANFYVWK